MITFATNSCYLWFSCLLTGMLILNYFKIKAKANHPAELPDPNGPLSAAVPLSTIAAVNKKVSSTTEKSASTDKSQGPYSHLTDEQKYCPKVSTNCCINDKTC